MKVVIFGASGNLGTSVATVLSRERAVTEIIGVSRRENDLALDKLRHVQADVARDDLRPLCAGAAAVIHLAWLIRPERDEQLLHAVNVEGSRRVFEAAAEAGVPAVLYSSSVGAYAPGPKDEAVLETWPTTGIESCIYSRQKAMVERRLDVVEAKHSHLRVVRMRPGLIFKREAGSEIRRYFPGRLVPRWLFDKDHVAFVPDMPRFKFQCVHSLDVGEAFRLALLSQARGAYNLAADPPLDAPQLSRLLHARSVKVSPRIARSLVAFAYQARLTPTNPSWLDMALGVPTMSSERARQELGWQPRFTASEALLDLLDGMHQGQGLPTAPLKPMHAGP